MRGYNGNIGSLKPIPLLQKHFRLPYGKPKGSLKPIYFKNHAFTSTLCNNSCNSPASNISAKMSAPPMNSPFT